jgi:hypothetical protein
MATLVDRSYLDQPRGSSYIDELLREAYEPSDDQPTKDSKALARLGAALADADAFLRRYIDAPLEWSSYEPRDVANIQPMARSYAINWLRRHTKSGSADPKLWDELKELTMDAAKLRERNMWTGSTVFQEPTKSQIVESASSFRYERLRGII